MKLRLGFVSNSSASSFVCDICGRTETGWDGEGYGVEIARCGSHEMCESHLKESFHEYCNHLPKDELVKLFEKEGFEPEKEDDLDEDDLEDLDCVMEYFEEYMEGMLPDWYCPICKMEQFIGSELAQFLAKHNNISREGIIKLVQSKFTTYKEFKAYIKDVNL